MKKGSLALAGALTAMALPGAASGADDGSAATAAQRGSQLTVNLVLRSRNGEPTKIKRFRFRHLRAFCDGGAEVEISGRIEEMAVNERNRFRGKIQRRNRVVRVRGRVSNDLDTVRGRIRALGDFGEATNCDSEWVRWVVR